jgi:hypothetical protein
VLLRTERERRTAVVRPGLLLLGVAVAQMLTLAVLGWNSDYWYDDLLHLGEVHSGLGVSYHDLMLPVFGHMIPGFRLVFWLLQHLAPGHYRVALLLEVLCSGGTTLVLGRILRLISNRPLASAVIASLIGVSAVQVATFTWFSQSLVALPSTLFSLLAIERFLVWWQGREGRPGRSRAALLMALLCWAAALSFYEKAALLPLWLVVLVVLVEPQRWSLREALQRLAGAWPAWVGLAGVGLVWLLLYRGGDYGSTVPRPSANQLSGFIAIAWFQNFWVSAVGGASYFGAPQGGILLRICGQAVFILLVVTTVAWRRGAWRSWAFFVAAFIVHVGLVGYGRAGWGADLGGSSFYTYETGWLLAIALGAAVARPSAATGPLYEQGRLASRVTAPPRVTGALVVLVVLLAGVRGGYAAATTYRPYLGHQVHQWAQNVRSNARQLQETEGKFSVFDDKAPAAFTQHDYPSQDRLSAVLGLGYASLHYDDSALPQYRLDPTGNLHPAHLEVQGSWQAAQAKCWSGPKRLALSHPVSGESLFWRLRTNQPKAVTVRLWTVGTSGGPAFATDTDGLVDLPAGASDILVPVLPTTAAAVYVNAPETAQVCVESVQLGQATG